ncbi:MAG: tetratricopeptide repeat protein, partial [Pseudomonadota bacterium]
ISQLDAAKRLAAESQDQWSLAVVLVEMRTDRRVTSAGGVANVDIGNTRDVVLSCLAEDPRRRPTMCKVVDALALLVADGPGGDRHAATGPPSEDGAPPPELLAQMHNNIGTAFLQQIKSSQEDFDWAEGHLKAALKLVEQLHGVESAEAATSHNNLAGLLKAQVRC